MDGGKFAYEAYSSTKGGTLKRRDGGASGGAGGGQQQGSGVSKKSAGHQHRGGKSCQCFGGTKRSKTKVFLTNLATNLGICLLLFGYTLVGSIVFLAIEGNSSISHQILATTSLASNSVSVNSGNSAGVSFTKTQEKHQQSTQSNISSSVSSTSSSINGVGVGVGHHGYELTESFKSRAEAVRAKTVENIWNITVNLNILYRDNWTRLAAQEISRFQDELVRALVHEEAALQLIAASVGVGPAAGTEHHELASSSHPGSVGIGHPTEFEWTFARSFLYSLTVLTTIGYGSVAPRTTLGKTVTMIYAILGIPLTLLYLSSVGAILSRIARGVFSRALCCCLCSNCGYCCYDEQRMADKERRMRKKRQQMELRAQAQMVPAGGSTEPFYVRGGGGEFGGIGATTFKDDLSGCPAADAGSLTDCDSKASSMQGLSILAPVTLCLAMMLLYICVGAFVLHRLERWPPLDAFYFCFMSLTTIGFGNMLPGGPGGVSSPTAAILSAASGVGGSGGGGRPPPPPPPPPPSHSYYDHQSNLSTWFCSLYIMSGMALTAMCFNVVHDEIIHRLRHVTASVAAAAAAATTGGAHQVHHHRGGSQARAKAAMKVGYLDDLGDCDPYHVTSPS